MGVTTLSSSPKAAKCRYHHTFFSINTFSSTSFCLSPNFDFPGHKNTKSMCFCSQAHTLVLIFTIRCAPARRLSFHLHGLKQQHCLETNVGHLVLFFWVFFGSSIVLKLKCYFLFNLLDWEIPLELHLLVFIYLCILASKPMSELAVALFNIFPLFFNSLNMHQLSVHL